MKRCHWIRIFLLSLCIHVVVFWPLPQSTPHGLQLQGSPLHVQLSQPLDVDRPTSEAIFPHSNAVKIRKSRTPPRPDIATRGEGRDVHKSFAATQPALPDSARTNVESQPGEDASRQPVIDLDAYKFALAAAITAHSRPQSNEETSALHGVTVVDVHLLGNSMAPRIVLADSSGVATVDTFALRLVRAAVERVASPSMLDGKNNMVRMVVMIGKDQP